MCGVANVLLLGLTHHRKACLDGRLDASGIVHTQRGLRNHGQQLGLLGGHLGHVGLVFHQVDAFGQLAHRAFHLRVTLVADHEELIALFGQFGHFYVHLGHQRAGGIKNGEATRLGLVLHRLAHAVGAEHQGGAGGHIVQLFNKDGALFLEVVDHKSVVHDFMAHIDGAAKLLQGTLHNLDGAVYARAKATGFSQQDFFGVHHLKALR